MQSQNQFDTPNNYSNSIQQRNLSGSSYLIDEAPLSHIRQIMNSQQMEICNNILQTNSTTANNMHLLNQNSQIENTPYRNQMASSNNNLSSVYQSSRLFRQGNSSQFQEDDEQEEYIQFQRRMRNTQRLNQEGRINNSNPEDQNNMWQRNEQERREGNYLQYPPRNTRNMHRNNRYDNQQDDDNTIRISTSIPQNIQNAINTHQTNNNTPLNNQINQRGPSAFGQDNQFGEELDESKEGNNEINIKKIINSPFYKDANLIMKNTCFSQSSFQLFFMLMFANILWEVSIYYNMGFLWTVDFLTAILTLQRIRLNQEFKDNSHQQQSKCSIKLIPEYIETLFSILFKVFLVLHLSGYHFNFFYVPLVLMIYVVMRGSIVMHLKIKNNQSIMTDIFIWGFKLFLSIQVLLVSLKYENLILWKWRDVFWAYWVFFSIMVGINIGFIIILFSKCYSKCTEEEVESYELQGLFWMFMISNSLTVNTTIYITSIISYLDENEKGDVFFAFQYGIGFLFFMILFSFISRQGINLFLYRITREGEAEAEDEFHIAIYQEQYQRNNQNSNLNQQQDQANNNNHNNIENQEVSRSEETMPYPNQIQIQIQEQTKQKPKKKKLVKVTMAEKISGFPVFFVTKNLFNYYYFLFQYIFYISYCFFIQFLLFFLKQKLSSTYFKSMSAVPKDHTNIKSSQDSQKTKESTSSQKNAINQSKNSNELPAQRQFKSNSFMSPKDGERKKGLEDLSGDFKNSEISSRREKRRLKSQMNNGDCSDNLNQSGATSRRGLVGSSLQESIRNMALDTEEKYNHFLQSSKGQEIQKKIYAQSLEEEFQKAHINLSYQEQKKQVNCDDIQDNQTNSQYINSNQEKRKPEKVSSDIHPHIQNYPLPQVIHEQLNSDDQNNNGDNSMRNNQLQQSANLTSNPNNQFIRSFTCDNKHVAVNNLDSSVANVCVICFDKIPDTVYMPCGHGGLCYECAIEILKKSGECYLCRFAISEVYQVDLKSREGQQFKVLAVTQLVDDSTIHPDSLSFDNSRVVPGSPNNRPFSLSSPRNTLQSPRAFSRMMQPLSPNETVDLRAIQESMLPSAIYPPYNFIGGRQIQGTNEIENKNEQQEQQHQQQQQQQQQLQQENQEQQQFPQHQQQQINNDEFRNEESNPQTNQQQINAQINFDPSQQREGEEEEHQNHEEFSNMAVNDKDLIHFDSRDEEREKEEKSTGTTDSLNKGKNEVGHKASQFKNEEQDIVSKSDQTLHLQRNAQPNNILNQRVAED